MGSRRNLLNRLADVSAYSTQTLSGRPLVEIAGDSRVLIENHCGVREYGHQQIVVNLAFGVAFVMGCHLEIIRMTKDQLIISGQIHGVRLQRRDGK